MGNKFSRMWSRRARDREVRLLMLGLDAAGKTTILYKLQGGEQVPTVPTVGFNVEAVRMKHVKFNVWDVGGQEKIRQLWRHYFTGAQGLVYVIDSSNEQRIDESAQELQRVLADKELAGCLLLVFANKQDMPGALGPDQITERLKLGNLKNREWCVVGSNAVNGDGLAEGLTWLSRHLYKDVPAK